MKQEKKVIILVIVAIILALTATILNIADSEISTIRSSSPETQSATMVGVNVMPAPVEDKLTEIMEDTQS